MKIFGFAALLTLFPLAEACKSTKTALTANETEISTAPFSQKLKLAANEMLTEQEALVRGELFLDNQTRDLATASRLAFGSSDMGRLMLNDVFWEKNYLSDFNHNKVVFWEPEQHDEVKDNRLLSADVDDMRGFDFSPLVIHMKKMPPWEAGPFVQHFIHIPVREGENRNHWKEGSLEYFFLPKEFKNIGNTHLPQAYNQFPDYTLPSNKWGATSFFLAEDRTNKMGNKGYTLTGSFVTPPSKRIKYDYDQWAYKSGAPYAYTQSQEKVNEWLEKVDERLLYKNFEDLVIKPNADIKHLVLNWEAFRDPYGPAIYKLKNCLDMWKKAYPEKTLSIWPKGTFEMNRINIEGNNYKYALTKDLNFRGTFNDWYNQLSQQSPFYINSFLKENADINYIGGYMNYPTNYGYIHHFLMQHMMNKKFFPEKKSVLMWWHNQEYVGGFEMGTDWFQGADGQMLQTQIKPMVFPSAMHNAAVWAFAFCDGAELWSEPYGRIEDKRFLGGNTEVLDKNGNKVATSFSDFQTGQYAIQNYRNIDRWEGGKWAVSMNKDIIEANTSWEFLSSGREGERLAIGDQVLPSYSLYEHTPLVAAKKSADGRATLLLVYDAWNDPLKQETIKVKIGVSTIPVKVFGRYTSVIRVE